MGGSSLAAEVFAGLPSAGRHLQLSVLDSTDPAAVSGLSGAIDPARTLFLAATKSGDTVETLAFLKHFYNLTLEAVGRQRAGLHFAAITDPGTGLQELAQSLGFRRVFLNEPEIGGRYSSLSHFGLVPARLAGADPARLLAGGRTGRAEIVDDGSGLRLGAVLGAGGGRRTRQAHPGRLPFPGASRNVDRAARRGEHGQGGPGPPARPRRAAGRSPVLCRRPSFRVPEADR